MLIRDVQLLADGFALGAYTMLLIHAVQRVLDDRRDARRHQHDRRIEAADYFRNSLRRYQRQARFTKMYAAGILEVSARDIEQDLRDGLDRVERAARDEGLL